MIGVLWLSDSSTRAFCSDLRSDVGEVVMILTSFSGDL